MNDQLSGFLVDRGNLVEGLDDPAVPATALLIQNLETKERTAWCHAGKRNVHASLIGHDVLARNDAGHMGAVAIAVQLVEVGRAAAQLPRLTPAGAVPLLEHIPILLEMRVIRPDAGVENRPTDVLAIRSVAEVGWSRLHRVG